MTLHCNLTKPASHTLAAAACKPCLPSLSQLRTFLLRIRQLVICRLLCLLPSILERAQAKVEQQRSARPLAQNLAALDLQAGGGGGKQATSHSAQATLLLLPAHAKSRTNVVHAKHFL